jgi:hypothetical protein
LSGACDGDDVLIKVALMFSSAVPTWLKAMAMNSG